MSATNGREQGSTWRLSSTDRGCIGEINRGFVLGCAVIKVNGVRFSWCVGDQLACSQVSWGRSTGLTRVRTAGHRTLSRVTCAASKRYDREFCRGSRVLSNCVTDVCADCTLVGPLVFDSKSKEALLEHQPSRVTMSGQSIMVRLQEGQG